MHSGQLFIYLFVSSHRDKKCDVKIWLKSCKDLVTQQKWRAKKPPKSLSKEALSWLPLWFQNLRKGSRISSTSTHWYYITHLKIFESACAAFHARALCTYWSVAWTSHWSRMWQDTSYCFDNSGIHPFCYAIVLRSLARSSLMFDTVVFAISREQSYIVTTILCPDALQQFCLCTWVFDCFFARALCIFWSIAGQLNHLHY